MINRDIVVTEYIGRQGLEMLLSAEKPEKMGTNRKMDEHFSRTFLKRPRGKLERDEDRRTPEEKAAAISGTLETIGVPVDNGIYCSRVGEGGILRSLWDMSRELKCGLNVDMLKLPVRQDVIEFCEYLEVDPYELAGGAEVRLIVTDNGMGLCDKLSQVGIRAAVVGYTIPGKQKILKIRDRVRYLDRPVVDQVRV